MFFFLFYAFSSLCLFSCFRVVTAQNTVHSVLFLIIGFCNAAGLLFLVEVEFIAMLLIIVYIGAIAVLFLFVVIMLDTRVVQGNSLNFQITPIIFFFSVIFLFELYFFSSSIFTFLAKGNMSENYKVWVSSIDSQTNIELLGGVLYSYYFFFFLVAGLVLLVAIIGAVIISLETKTTDYKNSKQELIFEQLSRSSQKAVFNLESYL